jgi:hypothetical protein
MRWATRDESTPPDMATATTEPAGGRGSSCKESKFNIVDYYINIFNLAKLSDHRRGAGFCVYCFSYLLGKELD